LQLASILRRAKEQGIPKDNIERALAKVYFVESRHFPFLGFDKAEGGKERAGETLIYEALVHNSVGLIM
jgi:translational activator of cytochrome c oxidase 1